MGLCCNKFILGQLRQEHAVANLNVKSNFISKDIRKVTAVWKLSILLPFIFLVMAVFRQGKKLAHWWNDTDRGTSKPVKYSSN